MPVEFTADTDSTNGIIAGIEFPVKSESVALLFPTGLEWFACSLNPGWPKAADAFENFRGVLRQRFSETGVGEEFDGRHHQ